MKTGSMLASAVVLCLVGCSAPTSADGTAPNVAEDTADTLDWGTSYNGWTQSPSGFVCSDTWDSRFINTFTRSYGDSTRGGGVCLVVQSSYWGSTDSACTQTAVSLYGTGAYGYSYGGQCYLRPGDQSTFCALTASAYPGAGMGPEGVASANFPSLTSTAGQSPGDDVWRVLGCMTKAAGPSRDCGSPDPSLYLHTLADAPWYGPETLSFCPY